MKETKKHIVLNTYINGAEYDFPKSFIKTQERLEHWINHMKGKMWFTKAQERFIRDVYQREFSK